MLCRFASLNAKGQLRPSIVTTPEFLALQAAGCSAGFFSPPADTLAPGSRCLAIIDVPDARAAALASTIAALDDGVGVRVLPNLRGGDPPSGAQRLALRSVLNDAGLDGLAASQASADFGDFIRYVLVTAWQNSEFDKARIT